MLYFIGGRGGPSYGGKSVYEECDMTQEEMWDATLVLEPISKLWISVQGKARGDSKAEFRPWRDEPSISRRLATPPWAIRRIFEMGFSVISD